MDLGGDAKATDDSGRNMWSGRGPIDGDEEREDPCEDDVDMMTVVAADLAGCGSCGVAGQFQGQTRASPNCNALAAHSTCASPGSE